MAHDPSNTDSRNGSWVRLQAALPALLSAVAFVSGAGAQTLVQYDPVGAQGSNVPVQPTSVANNFTANPLEQFGFPGWGNTDVWPVGQIGVASPVLDPNQYVTFDVFSSAPMQYTQITYSRRSYIGDGNRQATVRSSLDGFTSDVDTATGLNPTGDLLIAFDLTGLPPTSGSIGFRIYFFDAPTSGLDWVDLVSTSSNGTGLILSGFGAGLGATYCVPNGVNTTGSSGVISAGGSVSVASNSLMLTASSLPLNQFGIFITSATQGFVPMPGGSQGNLCLSGQIGRYNGPGQILNSGAAGSFTLMPNLAATPTPTGPVAVQVGSTRHFQAWYRDFIPGMGAVSNFTPGISVTFN